MNNDKLIQLFITLCETSSPSGKEARVSQFIRQYLSQSDWKVWVDTSGANNDSTTGNVYTYLEVDTSADTLLFCAHMDTVQTEFEKVKVVFDGKVFKSTGSSILGADNKAGIAALLYSAKYIDIDKLNHNILLFFPTREEAGKMGSSYFEFKKAKIKYGFNIDGPGSPGTFVTKSLGYVGFTITVKGKKAHAALDYDSGVNALVVASTLVTKLPLGKAKKYTVNIGSFISEGGTNVVPDLVILKGEVRAFTKKDRDAVLDRIKKIGRKMEIETHTKINVAIDLDSALVPFDITHNHELMTLCETACHDLQVRPTFETAYYCSDANSLSALGIPTVNVSRGGENGHSVQEALKYKDLVLSVELVKKLMYTK